MNGREHALAPLEVGDDAETVDGAAVWPSGGPIDSGRVRAIGAEVN